MGWLDDLRKDPDSTHAKLARRLYGQRIAAVFATPFVYEHHDGRRQAIVHVDVDCALVLLPPTDADEIAITLHDGRRLCIDASHAQRWRHMVAVWVATDRADKADLS